MSTLVLILVLVIVIPLVLAAVVSRISPLLRSLRSWTWRWQQAEAVRTSQPPSTSRVRHWGRWLRVASAHLVRMLVWPILSLRLRVEDFEGTLRGRAVERDDVEIDGAGVAATVRAGMLRASATGDSTPLFVAAPFSAAAAFSDVAAAVGDVAEKGKLAAAAMRLLALVARLLGRDELVLSGRLLSSTSRGPGVALLLAHANGRVVDSRILWADTYEVAGKTTGLTDPTDRMRRVAVAAAVWTQFTALRSYGSLTRGDYAETLGTAEWESYAFHQVAVRTTPEHADHDPAMRCLFAHAVDCDPDNLHARFNLAADAIGDAAREDGALAELESLHEWLESRVEGRARETASLQGLQAEDQFHFQVSHSRAVMALDRRLVAEGYPIGRSHDGGRSAGRADASLDDRLRDAWDDLTTDLVRLERALSAVDAARETRWGDRWASSLTLDSPEEIVRIIGFLRQAEGRMVAGWASIAFHLMRLGVLASVSDAELPGCPASPRAARDWLIARLEGPQPQMAHDAVVNEYILRRSHVSLDEHTHYNLACNLADHAVDRSEVALQLAQAMGTGHLRERALHDPQLSEYAPIVERLCDGQPSHAPRGGVMVVWS
jgi:hypothetical protein